LRENFLVAAADNFLLERFGDVFVLLDDPAQSKAVTEELALSLRFLARHVDRTVILAHSGGAIVTKQFLASAGPADLEGLELVVAFGQGLNLAWEQIDAYGSRAEDAKRHHPLLFTSLPESIAWVDVFATEDPAPHGPLAPPKSTEFAGLQDPVAITNLLSIRADHGAYWENDEEFLPLVAESIDRATPTLAWSSRRGRFDQTRREIRLLALTRWQRVRVRSYWHRVTTMVGVVAVLLAAVPYLIALDQPHRPIRVLGDAVATGLSLVPGSVIVSDFLARIHEAAHVVLPPGQSWLTYLAGGTMLSILGLWSYSIAFSPSPPWPPYRGSGVDRWQMAGRTVETLATVYAGGGLLAIVAGPVLIGLALTQDTAHLREIATTVRSLPIVVVFIACMGLGLGFGVLETAARRKLSHAMRDRARDQLGSGVLLPSMALAIGIALVVVVVAALVTDPVLGSVLLGAAAIATPFWILRRVGSWRWGAWDRREREIQRRYHALFVPRTAPACYFTLLTAALAVLVFSVWRNALELGLAIAGSLTAVVIIGGLAGDSLPIEEPRAGSRRHTQAGRVPPSPPRNYDETAATPTER
jgi:hypothetical protein